MWSGRTAACGRVTATGVRMCVRARTCVWRGLACVCVRVRACVCVLRELEPMRWEERAMGVVLAARHLIFFSGGTARRALMMEGGPMSTSGAMWSGGRMHGSLGTEDRWFLL